MSKRTVTAAPDNSLKKRSQLLEIWDRLKTNKLAMVGMAIVIVLILCAIFADFIAPYGINDQNLSERLMYPCLAHPLGTDNNGRDILSRIIYGGRISSGFPDGGCFLCCNRRPDRRCFRLFRWKNRHGDHAADGYVNGNPRHTACYLCQLHAG